MKILNFSQYNETVVSDKSVEQLKKIRKASKGTDIGDRISDMNTEGANIINTHNVLDGDIETREDFAKTPKTLCDTNKVGGESC